MKIAISSDHRGVHVYNQLVTKFKSDGHDIVDVPACDGHSCDYPDMAYGVGLAVTDGRADFGILICGSGLGMSIAANKIKGIRAAVVHDDIGAEMSRRHNDANVLCLSGEMLGERLIEKIVDIWLKTEFEGGRHARRVNKMTAIEQGKDPSMVTE